MVSRRLRSSRRLCGVLLATLGLAAPAAASMTVTEKLAEAQTADNDASWTSVGTFSIATGALGVCFVFQTDAAGGLTTPTLTGGSVATWTAITNGSSDAIATPTKKITAFRGLGTGASAAAVTVDFAADSQTSVAWNCWELTNPNTSTPITQFKTAATDSATSLNVTFDATTQAAQVVMVAAMASNDKTWTPSTGFSVGTEQLNNTPNSETKVEYKANDVGTTYGWSWSGASAPFGALGIEVAEATSTARPSLVIGGGILP